MKEGAIEFEMFEPPGGEDGGRAPDALDGGAALEPLADFVLRELLEEWREPRAPESLQFRVVNSFRLQLRTEEVVMNRCPKCRREFAPQYRFCPVDGLPLAPEFYVSAPESFAAGEPFAGETSWADEAAFAGTNGGHRRQGNQSRNFDAAVARAADARGRGEYRLTLVEDAGLLNRLTAEVRGVARESRLTWPELKRDPSGSARRGVAAYVIVLRRLFAQPNVAYGVAAGLAVILSVVLAAVVVGRLRGARMEVAANNVLENYEVKWVTDIPPPAEKQPDEGSPGMAKGTGGGSKPKQEKSGGSGGGGRNETKPASAGELPLASLDPQVLAPNPHPPAIKNPTLPVRATIQADPTPFPPDPRVLPYGDPKSNSTDPSAGTGTGNGIGDGTGGGVGSGNGTGYGPGEGMNTGDGPPKLGGGGPGGPPGLDYTKTFPPKEVTRRAVILSRPEPQYTEEARKSGVTGEVMLRAVLSSGGQITNIQPMKRLPDGLTEKAIEAARRITFTPAEKDGRPVSQYITLVYNFNIY
ncbi:MAG: TonB family protein [Pyrinomonadaceae bacterium]|nr:TonB family protein [Pyrinomonadaceae bacterium]